MLAKRDAYDRIKVEEEFKIRREFKIYLKIKTNIRIIEETTGFFSVFGTDFFVHP